MRILVDGDGCAGKEFIEKVGKEYELKIIIYCDLNHNIKSDYSKIIYLDSGFQSVDIKIANSVKKEDIVVTQDFGVAAMVLSKGAYAISPKGHIYDNENIDRLLFERHLSYKVRKAGGKTNNPKKRSKDDNERLYFNLKKIIKNNLEKD